MEAKTCLVEVLKGQFQECSCLILINDAGFKEINNEIGIKITSAVNKRKEMDENHWKYVDDLTIEESIDLKQVLKNDTEKTLEKPLTYHNR